MKPKRETLEALASAVREAFWREASVDVYPTMINLLAIEVCGIKVGTIACKYGSYGWELDFESKASTVPPSGLSKLHNRIV